MFETLEFCPTKELIIQLFDLGLKDKIAFDVVALKVDVWQQKWIDRTLAKLYQEYRRSSYVGKDKYIQKKIIIII